MRRNTSDPKKRVFTLPALEKAIQTRILGSDEAEIRALRPPSMPTLKNMSRKGVLKNMSLDAAVQRMLEHLLKNAQYYPLATAQEQEQMPPLAAHAQSPAVRLPGAPDERALLQEILGEVQQLSRRVAIVERAVADANKATAVGVHPAVLAAVEQLHDTRKYIMSQFDSQRQNTIKTNAPREFEAASAMDAQRILAGISRLNDTIGKLSQAGS
jgi:hypothetical protein